MRFWLIVLTVTALTMMPGVQCETTPGGPADDPTVTAAVYSETEAFIQSLLQQVARLEAKEVSGQRLSADEAATLARSKTRIMEFQSLLSQAQAAAAADNRQPDLGGPGTLATSLLPPPFNILGGLAAGGLAEFWRGRKKRVSFGRLVNALDTAKAKIPSFSEAMDAAGPTIKTELGTTARTMVDKMRDNGA